MSISSSKKVFVGLSGGVDSAVSAALLQKEGADVTGVFIKIQIPGYPCPAAEDRLSAQRVAAHLRIPFVEIDLSDAYTKEVFTPSIEEYRKGRTPNPDTLCNEKIKFGVFFNWCREHGADYVATGHYARIKSGLLYAGVDKEKDQSYFLWMVPKAALLHTLFPVGELEKSEVRRLAEKFDLPNSKRKDSQGLCFLGDISIEEMLTQELKPTKGNVLNEKGEIIGTHDGAALYTLGERHGFTLNAHTPNTAPHYVIGKDTETNSITVSTSKTPIGMTKTEIKLEHTNWIGEIEEECMARFRYRQPLVPATCQGDTALLGEAHYVPLGQSLVAYKGERCLGGGIVSFSSPKP